MLLPVLQRTRGMEDVPQSGLTLETMRVETPALHTAPVHQQMFPEEHTQSHTLTHTSSDEEKCAEESTAFTWALWWTTKQEFNQIPPLHINTLETLGDEDEEDTGEWMMKVMNLDKQMRIKQSWWHLNENITLVNVLLIHQMSQYRCGKRKYSD